MSGRPREYLVISDTHGKVGKLRLLAKVINFCPAGILFLGDGLRDLDVLSDIPSLRDIPVYAVSGNCDSWFSLHAAEPTTRLLPVGNHKIFMTHGHLYGVRGGLDAAAANALAAGADVLLYGHTHVASEYTRRLTDADGNEKTLLIANPGSLGEPRDGGACRFGVLTLGDDFTLFGHGEV